MKYGIVSSAGKTPGMMNSRRNRIQINDPLIPVDTSAGIN